MASSEVQMRTAAGPRRDRLGMSCFLFHIGLGIFVIAGWLFSSYEALTLYLVLLPGMALQWMVNRGSCMVNNVESWLRTGRWRDPDNREEGGFLAMICEWLFAARPGSSAIDRYCYAVVALLWILGASHYSLLTFG